MRIIVKACIALASCTLLAAPVPAMADGHHHGGGNHGGGNHGGYHGHSAYNGGHRGFNGGHGQWANRGNGSHQHRGNWNNGSNRWNGHNYAHNGWNRHNWNGNSRWNGRNYAHNDWGRRHYGNGRNVVIERNYYNNGGSFDPGYYRNDYVPWRYDNGNNFASGLATGIIGAGIVGLMQNLNRPEPDVVYANEDRFPDPPPPQNTAVEAPAHATAKATTGPITIVIDGKGNATCKADDGNCPANVKVITPPAQHDTVIIQTPEKSETTTVPQTTIIEKKTVVCTCATTLSGEYLYTCLGQPPVIMKACPKP